MSELTKEVINVLAKEEAMFKIMQHPVLIEELSKNSGIKSVRYLKAKLKKFIKKRNIFWY